MVTKTLLNVPYTKRHDAKALGARWDVNRARWYITDDMDPTPFQSWIKKTTQLMRIRLQHAYLLERKVPCFRCHDQAQVYCLGTRQLICSPRQEKHVGFFTLFHVTTLPKDFYHTLHQRFLTFFMNHECHRTQLTNHCLCGAVIDDLRLHRPGPQSFRPLNPQQATEIHCCALPIPVKGLIQCQWRTNPLLVTAD